MSEKRNDQSSELTREIARQRALLENRLKIFATAGVVFDLTSEQIEDSITAFFTDNGIDCEAERLYVRCVWNKEWDQYIFHKDSSNVPKCNPFDTFILLRPQGKKNKKGENENSDNRVMNSIMKNIGTTSRNSFFVLNNNNLNALIQYQFKNDKKFEWKLINNGAYAKVRLDFDSVMSYIFAEDKTNSRVVYDILRKENYNNKTSHKGVFAIKILKTYYNEFKYKNAHKDPIDFLRGDK